MLPISSVRIMDDCMGRPTTIRRLVMSKRFKMWAYVAALLGGTMLSGGCFGGAQLSTILAILQEDLFG